MAKKSNKRFIDPGKLTQISRMELVARQAVEGFLSGLHPSPYYGSSVEYADHRPYTMGDEIRTIDWKLLAKTDKYYVKLFEEQTNTRCTLLLDVSNSMKFGPNPLATKLEYACQLTAALSYLAIRQNDAVGLTLFDSDIRQYLPARSTAYHFRQILDQLETVEAGSDTGIGHVLHQMAARVKQRGLVIVISDLIDDVDAITDGLAHFRYKKHEVIVFHILDTAEIDFPYDKTTRFKDIEGTGSIIANPRSVKTKYQERLNQWLDDVRRGCLERGIAYELATTDTPWDQTLRAYLARRKQASR